MLYSVMYNANGHIHHDEPAELGSAINAYALYHSMGWDVIMNEADTGNVVCDWIK